MESVSTSTPPFMERLHFFDEFAGNCITAEGNIFKTTDKGLTWTQTFSRPSNDFKLSDLMFLDKKTGFAVGGNTSCNGSGCILPDGLILKTTNGGDSWQIVKRIPKSDMMAITKSDNGILYATNLTFLDISPSTATTKILKSVDLGQTWDSVGSIKVFSSRITCNGETVFVTGGIGLGKIFRGTNQGTTWAETILDKSIYTTEIAFKNGIGYCLANNQSLFKTTDDGVSWVQVFKDTNSSSRMVVFSDKECLLFGTGENLTGAVSLRSAYKKTGDGGKTWEQVEFNSQGFYATHFFDSKIGYTSNRSNSLVKITLK